MPQTPPWLSTLTETAKQQDIDLPLAQAEAFQHGDSSELEFWVQDKLSEQVCLTSEELAMYVHLVVQSSSLTGWPDGKRSRRGREVPTISTMVRLRFMICRSLMRL